jgi:hypothetical protein
MQLEHWRNYHSPVLNCHVQLYPVTILAPSIVVSRDRERKRYESPEKGKGIFIFKKGRETSILRVVAEKVNDVCKRRGLKPNYLARRVGRFSLKRLSLD